MNDGAADDGVGRRCLAVRARDEGAENNSIETTARVVDASAAIGGGVGERSEETVAFEEDRKDWWRRDVRWGRPRRRERGDAGVPWERSNVFVGEVRRCDHSRVGVRR